MRVEESNKQAVITFAVVVLASALGNLSQTGLNAMLVSVCDEFGIAEGVGQWLTTSYMLALGIVVPLSSYFMGRFRMKTLVMLSICIFFIGSLIDALALSFAALFVAILSRLCLMYSAPASKTKFRTLFTLFLAMSCHFLNLRRDSKPC